MVCREIEMGKLKCKRYWPMSKDEKMSFAGMQISLVSNISHYYFNSLPVAPCSNNKIHCSNICLLVHPFTRPLIPSCRSLKKTAEGFVIRTMQMKSVKVHGHISYV